MSLFLAFPDGTRPTACANPVHHSPRPQRYVVHHVLPQTCGGLTVKSNLVGLCDGCHYATHVGMWALQNESSAAFASLRLSRYVVELARSGWSQAVAAGTADRIPKESAA